MPKKHDFKLDVVSVRLLKDAPIYSEHTFNNPADIAAVMGDCMCQFDREVAVSYTHLIKRVLCVRVLLYDRYIRFLSCILNRS